MNHFEIKTDRVIRDELRSVRKNKFMSLLPTARAIKDERIDLTGLEFALGGKHVPADEFADAVLQLESDRIEKLNRETKLIWVQQGVSHKSGYHKRVKVA